MTARGGRGVIAAGASTTPAPSREWSEGAAEPE
jgi:hypothetical protein